MVESCVNFSGTNNTFDIVHKIGKKKPKKKKGPDTPLITMAHDETGIK